jgi:hypothetical protein
MNCLHCSGYGGGGEGGLTNELDSLRKVVREQAAQCQYLKEQLRSVLSRLQILLTVMLVVCLCVATWRA